MLERTADTFTQICQDRLACRCLAHIWSGLMQTFERQAVALSFDHRSFRAPVTTSLPGFMFSVF